MTSRSLLLTSFFILLAGAACSEDGGAPDAGAGADAAAADARAGDAAADATPGDAMSADAAGDGGVGVDADGSAPPSDAGGLVGPAPGFSVAATSSVGGGSSFGTDVSMALDENGVPMLAYVWEAPLGVAADGAVYFVRWDASAGAWTAPVRVEVIGPIFTNAPLRHLSLSRDPSTGVIGIAYGRFNTRTPPRNELVYSVHLALSLDGGETWSNELLSERMDPTSGGEEAYAPSLALRDGRTHVAYPQRWQHCTSGSNGACPGVWYLTRTGTAGDFQRSLAPLLTGTSGVRMTSLALALNAQGDPAVAYYSNSDDPSSPGSYTTNLAFWRPGSAPVHVNDSAGIQNDTPALSLAFRGDAPRIAEGLARETNRAADVRMWSSVNGDTWTSSVTIPRDGGDEMSWYFSLAVRGDGAHALASGSHTGSGGSACSAPKLSRSSDGVAWTTCGMDRAVLPSGSGDYVQAAFGPDGKLWLAFQRPETDAAAIAPGIVVWREP